MQLKLLKIGWILMLVLGIYRTVTAIILAATGEGDLSGGISLAATGVAIIGITLGSYRKAEKWSWWCLLVVGLAPLLGCTIIHGIQIPTLIGWILFILAMVIPLKAIFSNKSA